MTTELDISPDDAEIEAILRRTLVAVVPRLLGRDSAPIAAEPELQRVHRLHRLPPVRRHRAIGLAAALMAAASIVGLIALTQRDAGSPPVTEPETDTTLAEVGTGPGLLLPPDSADADVSSVQRTPALPGRTRAVVQAPDASMIAVNLTENFWGTLPAGMEQRSIGGNTVGFALEDSNRSYVITAPCAMFAVGDGDHNDPWRAEIVDLFGGTTIDDAGAAVSLPAGWKVVRSGSVGEWFLIQYTRQIDGSPQTISLTQMPGSNAGSLLADFAGRGVVSIDFRGESAWRVPPAGDDVIQVIWEHDGSAYMIGAKSTTVEQLAGVVDGLVAQTSGDWDRRFGDRDNHTGITVALPVPADTTVSCSSPQLRIGSASGRVHPEPGTYVLAAGDFPSTVAQKFKVTLQDLLTFNGWTLVGNVVDGYPPAGTTIKIPPRWTDPDPVIGGTLTESTDGSP